MRRCYITPTNLPFDHHNSTTQLPSIAFHCFSGLQQPGESPGPVVFEVHSGTVSSGMGPRGPGPQRPGAPAAREQDRASGQETAAPGPPGS